MLTDTQKAEQWQRIQREHPDLAEFIRELVKRFGKLEGIYKARDDGWFQPQIEGRKDERKDERGIGRNAR